MKAIRRDFDAFILEYGRKALTASKVADKAFKGGYKKEKEEKATNLIATGDPTNEDW